MARWDLDDLAAEILVLGLPSGLGASLRDTADDATPMAPFAPTAPPTSYSASATSTSVAMGKRPTPGLAVPAHLQSLFAASSFFQQEEHDVEEGFEDEDEEEDEEERPPEPPARVTHGVPSESGYLAPVASPPPAPKGKAKAKVASMTAKLSQSDLLRLVGTGELKLSDVLMLQAVEALSATKAARPKHLNEGSDSGGDESKLELMGHRGLRQIQNLGRIKKTIEESPDELIEEFELQCRELLGVLPSQPWTLRDWRRRLPFGKHLALARCTEMDVAVYMLLAQGRRKVAMAQLIQNMRAKLQTALDGGLWTQSWLYTGLPDPFRRPEFAAPESQVCAVAGYVKSMGDLRKQRNAASNAPVVDGDEEDVEATERTPWKSAAAKKKAAAAAKKAAAAATAGGKGE